MRRALVIAPAVVAALAAAGPLPAGAQRAPADSPTTPATARSTAAARPPAPPAPAPVPLATVVGSDYVIGPEDVLQISVWKNESISRVVPVRPDGKISIPLLHDVTAAGLTPMQLRAKLAAALAEFMPSPEVSVTVTEVRSFRVSVLGAVQRPGVLQLRSATTILEAIAMAGGFNDFASPSKIVVFRRDPRGRTQRLRFNYNRALSSAGEDDLALRTGDVIVVP